MPKQITKHFPYSDSFPMSYRINCPECDTVFEPRPGVWSAHCPFCGCRVEVPHSVDTIDASQFRKRIRKPPGWLIRLQAHLPSWANFALICCGVLITLSVVMQAWVVTHADRSAMLMRRAIDDYQSLSESADEMLVVQACDKLLDLWTTSSARLEADRAGLTEDQTRRLRRDLIRKSWNKRLEAMSNSSTSPLQALEGESKLLDETANDPDLKDFSNKARTAWRTTRDGGIQSQLDLCQAQIDSNRPQESLKSLMNAEQLQARNLAEVPAPTDSEPRFRSLLERLSKWRGVSPRILMTESNFTSTATASSQILPLIVSLATAKGYALAEFADQAHQTLFLKSAAYTLDLQISERFGRGFEETPHRTTLIEVRMNLLRSGKSLWNQVATARTSKIPAQTAMGMSRLQLSKQSDERIERKLNEAAWETLPKAINQSMQLLEAARNSPNP